jgi:translation initiation factor IF-1
MRPFAFSAAAIFGAWTLSGVSVPAQTPPAAPNVQIQAQQNGQSLRGTILRRDGNDRIVVRTQDNAERVLIANPQTRYLIDGRNVQFSDLQVGAPIQATYSVEGDRYLVSQVQVNPGNAQGNAPAQAQQQDPNVRTFRGRVAKITLPNQLVVKAADGKEAMFQIPQDARILVNNNQARLEDLKVGHEVQVSYVERDSHWFAQNVVVEQANAQAPNQNPQPNANEIQGSVVRIVGKEQVIVRTSDGKEVTVFVQPQSTYSINNQPVQLSDFQPGYPIRVQTETRDRRLFGRTFLGLRRNP